MKIDFFYLYIMNSWYEVNGLNVSPYFRGYSSTVKLNDKIYRFTQYGELKDIYVSKTFIINDNPVGPINRYLYYDGKINYKDVYVAVVELYGNDDFENLL